MEHTTKMYLVPQHQIDKLKQPSPQDSELSIRRVAQTELDKEIAHVLDSPCVDIHEKAKKYTNILQRYLSLVRQGEREKTVLTLSSPIAQTYDAGVTTYPDDGDVFIANILKHIPKRSQKNAEYILDALRGASDRVSWTEQGEIVFNGQVFKGSHVHDLIKNVTATHNVSDAARPPGWKKFLKTLADLNMPLSVVPNAHVRGTLSILKNSFNSFSDTSSETSAVGIPVVKRKRKNVVLSPSFRTPMSQNASWSKY